MLLIAGKPLLDVYTHAWSEGPYCVLCVAAFFVLGAALTRRRPGLLIAAAGLCAAAALTRYIGVAMVPAGVVVLLAGWPGRVWRRIGAASLWAVVTLVPTVAWLLVNVAATGTAAGPRPPTAFSAATIARGMAATVWSWIWPPADAAAVPLSFAAAALGMLGLAVVVVGIAVWRRHGWADAADVAGVGAPLLLALCQAGALFALASVTAMDTIADRLVSPVFAPLVVFACAVTARAWRASMDPRRGRAAGAVAVGASAVVVVLLLGAQTARAQHLLGSAETGDLRLRYSPLVRFAQQNPGAQIITNNTAIQLFVRDSQVLPAPLKYQYNSTETVRGALAAFRSEVQAAKGDSYLLWFDYDAPVVLHSWEELAEVCPLTPVGPMRGGSVYRISRACTQSPPPD